MRNPTEALRVALTNHFVSTRQLAGLTMPVEIWNQPEHADQSGVWGRFSIVRGTRAPFAIGGGGGYKRQTGLVALQVFVPIEGGTKPASQALDSLIEMFDDKSLNLTLSDGSPAFVQFRSIFDGTGSVGNSGVSSHLMSVFYAPFYYDTQSP